MITLTVESLCRMVDHEHDQRNKQVHRSEISYFELRRLLPSNWPYNKNQAASPSSSESCPLSRFCAKNVNTKQFVVLLAATSKIIQEFVIVLTQPLEVHVIIVSSIPCVLCLWYAYIEQLLIGSGQSLIITSILKPWELKEAIYCSICSAWAVIVQLFSRFSLEFIRFIGIVASYKSCKLNGLVIHRILWHVKRILYIYWNLH
jgi:hypothetical protein